VELLKNTTWPKYGFKEVQPTTIWRLTVILEKQKKFGGFADVMQSGG
jgi:hypothetical protein